MNKLQESQHIERKLTLELENQKERLLKERRNLIDLETDLTYRQQRLKGRTKHEFKYVFREVQNQTQSMNAVCVATIQAMEQAIQSIDTFATDTVLQGQTYSSAKIFFVQTFRPLAQGIIYLCEELIRQNDAFPSDFQSQVASTDVIEQEIREQIQEINRMISSIESISIATVLPGIDAIVIILVEMRKNCKKN